MKRKLISFDAFDRLQRNSLSSAEAELREAGDYLSKAVGCECLKLAHYSPESVTYECCDGTYLHSNYSVNENSITFSNLEELKIDEQSEREKAKEILAQFVEALLEEEDQLAERLFKDYLRFPSNIRAFKQGIVMEGDDEDSDDEDKDDDKKNGKKGKKLPPWLMKKDDKKDDKKKMKHMKAESVISRGLVSANKSALMNIYKIAGNVNEFATLKLDGPTFAETRVQLDEKGTPAVVSIPSKESRWKNKVQQFKWNVLSADNVVHRMNANKLSENHTFIKAVAELKRHHALSDDNGTEEMIENIVSEWPHVLYLTQSELAQGISEALTAIGSSNYDDEMCNYLAEGILRKAHSVFVDRVHNIQRWANVDAESLREENEDNYEVFKKIVDQFYPRMDEQVRVEMQAYVDLYEAFRFVRELALEDGNRQMQIESEVYLDQLIPVLNGQVAPNAELALAGSEYLADLIETNLETAPWNPSNSVHTTVSGDHPRMSQIAKQGYVPASDFTGDWGDTAPVSDGKNYKGGLADQMRNSAWGNIGGNDTYPSLNNPYILTPFGDYKIKGEKDIDSDSGQIAHFSGSDTWPNLQNPNVPKAETPQSYKMNHGKEKDLVVDM